jgi:hypothetical protein
MVTAVEQARDLPRQAVELPVTVVSQALQASMRVQQRLTELAIKGDRALSALRPVEEKPSWATFDEDDESPAPTNGRGRVATIYPKAPQAPQPEPDDLLEPELAPEPEDVGPTPATVAAAEVTAWHADGGTPDGPVDPTAGGPNVLPGYAEMTIPQLRARLRRLSAEDLQALLDWETAHGDRPAYVTMLSNRIATVTGG